MKILVSDPIAREGIEILRQYAEVDVNTGLDSKQLQSIISNYDALIVRSQTKVTSTIIESGHRLQVIGRAGIGIDNIDVDAATRSGIIVVNSPEGNVVSTAEHTIAMLLALARHIPKANSQIHSGIWNRSIKGVQIRNKTLGIIGLGRVGTQVADMARGLHMGVVSFDPIISEDKAVSLGVKMVELNELLKMADFITIHVPSSSSSKGLIGEKQLKLMKSAAMIINCARGGIVDEVALYKALEHGYLAGAAIDVFSEEPAGNNILLTSDRVIATPHLAASTIEAERSASIDIASQVVDILKGCPAKSPVNFPMISQEAMYIVGPYILVGTIIARIAVQLMEGQLNSLSILYQGDIAAEDTKPIKIAILAGLLESLTEERVSMVNAEVIADSRGLRVIEQKASICENYTNLVTLSLETKSGSIRIAGSSIRGKPHLIRINDFWLEIEPTGSYMLFTEHKDEPGMIGKVGTILGNANINISQMQVSRGVYRGGIAMMVLCLDDPINNECHQQILSIGDMNKALIVKL